MTFGVLGVNAEVHKKFAVLFEKITSFMFIWKIWQQWIRQNKLHFLLRIQQCIFNMVSPSSNANILFLFRHFILLFFFTPVDISVANDQRYQQTMSIGDSTIAVAADSTVSECLLELIIEDFINSYFY